MRKDGVTLQVNVVGNFHEAFDRELLYHQSCAHCHHELLIRRHSHSEVGEDFIEHVPTVQHRNQMMTGEQQGSYSLVRCPGTSCEIPQEVCEVDVIYLTALEQIQKTTQSSDVPV